MLFIERLEENECFNIPHIAYSVSARIDPHKGVQQHSLDTSLKLGHISMDFDGLNVLLDALKKRRSQLSRPSNSSTLPLSPTSPEPSSVLASTPPTATRPLSPPLASPKSILRRPTSPTPSLTSLTSWRSSVGAFSVCTDVSDPWIPLVLIHGCQASIKFRRDPRLHPVRKVQKEKFSVRENETFAPKLPLTVSQHCRYLS